MGHAFAVPPCSRRCRPSENRHSHTEAFAPSAALRSLAVTLARCTAHRENLDEASWLRTRLDFKRLLERARSGQLNTQGPCVFSPRGGSRAGPALARRSARLTTARKVCRECRRREERRAPAPSDAALPRR